MTGDYVFSTTAGERPVSGFSRAKARLDARIKEASESDEADLVDVSEWRAHDLRRTAATGMRRLGVHRDDVGAVLNHAPRGVTAEHYDQYEQLPEKRAALEAWGRKIQSIIEPGQDDTVVELRV